MFRRGGETTAINARGRRILQTTFKDGTELVEEYSLQTGDLLVRRRQQASTINKNQWEYIVGDPPSTAVEGIIESTQNPIFSRKDNAKAFQWRVRNLPYDSSVFSVQADSKDRQIVIRTSNKKYYKRFSIPELDILQLEYEAKRLSWTHSNNTLIISYTKHPSVIQEEKKDLEALKKLQCDDSGDVDCKQQ